MAQDPALNTRISTNTSRSSLRARTLIFLTLLMILSSTGAGLMWYSHERLLTSSDHMRERLMPVSRLIEQARHEIDLQIQELTLVSQFRSDTKSSPADQGILRPRAAVRALELLESSPFLPKNLKPLFTPWVESAHAYTSTLSKFENLGATLQKLKDLQQRTLLLQRAVHRELSLELLSLSSSGRNYALWGSAAAMAGVLASVLFIILIWQWMRPLEQMKRWLQQRSENPTQIIPPPSMLARGPLAAPADVQELIEALRYYIHQFGKQARELEIRAQRTQENERAMGTLFSALQHLMRHNEELVDELIKKERLASMGEMAAKLAHEIRNPLNSMNLKLELLRDELSNSSQQEQIEKILAEIDRLDALTESYLRTTRARLSQNTLLQEGALSSPSSEESLVSQVILDTLDTIKPELEMRSIQLEILPSPLPSFPSQVPANILKAALVNLIKNAWEAIDEELSKYIENGGTGPTPSSKIRIELGHDGYQWTLTVQDTGCGFPEEYLKNPFESFRTSKKEGSGLGLVSSLRMLSPYNVDLRIESGTPPFKTKLSLVALTSRSLELHDSYR